jgi:ribosomal-protein-alanine N-acetyltransferase
VSGADGPGVRLRPMRWWDVEAVHALERSLFPHDAWSQELFWSELAGVPDSRWYVVAERGDDAAGPAVVGYAGLFAVPPEADVQTVAVAAPEQGRGLGRRLLHALLGEARRRGCTSLVLEVAADNEPARALYAGEGFETLARRSRYYPDGTDALVMRRRLGEGDARG